MLVNNKQCYWHSGWLMNRLKRFIAAPCSGPTKLLNPLLLFFKSQFNKITVSTSLTGGIFKGISKAERDAHPELGPLWKKVKDNIRFATEHQGETFDQFADRIQLFLQDLTQQQAGQQVLVVAHGFVKRMLLAQLLNKPYEELQDYYWENASFSILRQQQSMFHVEQLHVTDHLA